MDATSAHDEPLALFLFHASIVRREMRAEGADFSAVRPILAELRRAIHDGARGGAKPSVHFLQGLPGSGKGWILRNRIVPSLQGRIVVLDPDAIKSAHPAYDPKDPQALHAWSKRVERHLRLAAQAAIVAGARDLHVVIDGCAAEAGKLARRLQAWASIGARPCVVSVRVPLCVSLRRNAERARTVPAPVIFGRVASLGEAERVAESLVPSLGGAVRVEVNA
jgi:hypothetical protein